MVQERPSLLARYNHLLEKLTARSPFTDAGERAQLRLFIIYILFAILGAFFSVIFYLAFFFLTGIRQGLYTSLILLVTIPTSLAALSVAISGRLRLGALILSGIIMLLYSILALLYSNLFYLCILGGGMLIALTILLAIPQEWYWGWPFLLLLSFGAWLADQIPGLNRFNPQDSPVLWGFILTVTTSILVIGLVLLLRVTSTGNIQTKLVAIVAVAAILPTLTVSLVTNTLARRALTQAAEQSLLSTATQTATAVDTFITTNLNLISAHAGLSDIINYLQTSPDERNTSPDTTRARRLLLQLSRLDTTYISSYAILDANGLNVLDTILGDIGRSEADAVYFQTPLRTGRPYASDMILGLGPRNTEIFFSAPVRNVRGEIIGVLRVRYNASIIQQMVYQSSEKLGPGSAPILLDEHLVRLADGTNNNLVLTPLTPLDAETVEMLKAARRLPAMATINSGTSLQVLAQGLSRYTEDPVFSAEAHVNTTSKDLVAVAALNTKPWLVAMAQPQDEFLRPIVAQERATLLVAVAAIVAISAFTAWRSQAFSRPIFDLTRASERMMRGELDTVVTINSQDEIGILANSFNSMAAQVRDLVSTLEQRVQARTAALVTSAAVGRRLATILDEGELVRAVVQEIQSAFNYYHVHIYLLDPQGKKLLIAGGTGEPGRIMLAHGHQLAVGQGLVGRAAMGQVYLSPDTQDDPDWLPNPLLPETRSEVAVPIIYGNEVLGVLDVQQNVVNGLNESDVDLLQSIASQVAISLRNARLYAEIQKQARGESLISNINEMILQTTSMEEAMQVAVRELGRALNAPYARIKLYPESENGKRPFSEQ